MNKKEGSLFVKYEKRIVPGMYFCLFFLFVFTAIFSKIKGLGIIYFLRDPLSTLKAPFIQDFCQI